MNTGTHQEHNSPFSHHRGSLLGDQRKHGAAWLSQTSQRLWLAFIRHQGRRCCLCDIHRQNPDLCEEQILEVSNISSHKLTDFRYRQIPHVAEHLPILLI